MWCDAVDRAYGELADRIERLEQILDAEDRNEALQQLVERIERNPSLATPEVIVSELRELTGKPEYNEAYDSELQWSKEQEAKRARRWKFVFRMIALSGYLLAGLIVIAVVGGIGQSLGLWVMPGDFHWRTCT
jgi:hypothetical protein